MSLRTIQTKGAKLVVDENGAAEPALLFLHYWGGSARTWSSVVAQLPLSVRSVAVNQRGWGGSVATDARYDLDALADDVLELTEILKVAQILAARRPRGLEGLVLVAPAPPTPMQVPDEARAGMLASYRSREGVSQALGVLAGSVLEDTQREQVIADTLRGDEGAKLAWPQHGMTLDISASLRDVKLPVDVLVGERDQVEREPVLRPAVLRFLPQAAFTIVPGAGHLLPLEAPAAIASICMRMISTL